MARELVTLRDKGVLIIGSVNIVHNLGMVALDKVGEPEFGYDWAIQANDTFKQLILNRKHKELINYSSLGREAQLAIPSSEHYLL